MDISKELFRVYIQRRHYLKGNIFNTALSINKPLHWNTFWSRNNSRHEVLIRKLVNDYGYEDGWTCSTCYPENQSIAFLAMIGKRVEADLRSAAIIEHIIPYFSEVVKAMCFSKINTHQQTRKLKLTPRQLDVLNWIKEGKTAWEISVILNCSERVVIWHANNIIKTLGAQNRTHAVVIAMRNNLID